MIIRNRKSIVILLIVVIVGVASIILLVVKMQKHELAVKAVNSEIAITKGLQYLQQYEPKVSVFQRLLLDYLQRKFDLSQEFSGSVNKIQQPADAMDADKFRVFRRIAYPNELVDSLPAGFDLPTARLLMASTHCDHIPLPENFTGLIKQNLSEGGYGVTYVALSLEIMKENNCSLPIAEDQRLREQTAAGMATIIKDHTSIPDMRYGAIALMMHINRHDLVESQWLSQVISDQNPDGGWRSTFNNNDSDDHATVMALWALLEYPEQETRDEPFIRRPETL